MHTMEERSVIHNTFVIERDFAATPERVFAAFADPDKKRRWFGENKNHDVELFEMDFRVGGMERAQYRFNEGTPFKGATLTNDGSYHDIVPNQRIVVSSRMAIGGKNISVSLATFEFLPSEKGTELIFTYQSAFLEGADGPEMRQNGWRTLFDRLSEELGR